MSLAHSESCNAFLIYLFLIYSFSCSTVWGGTLAVLKQGVPECFAALAFHCASNKENSLRNGTEDVVAIVIIEIIPQVLCFLMGTN